MHDDDLPSVTIVSDLPHIHPKWNAVSKNRWWRPMKHVSLNMALPVCLLAAVVAWASLEGLKQAQEVPARTVSRVLLPEGTPVKLKLLHSINSKTAVADDPLNFTVAEDVVVDGKTAVKAGVVAIGRIRQVKRARTLGRGAELMLEMEYMRVGARRVPLRGTQARAGEGKTGDVVALVTLFGLSGLLKHGSEIEVKEGSIMTAYVGETTEIPIQPEQ